MCPKVTIIVPVYNTARYLVECIKKFHNQQELAKVISNNGFSNVEFRNLSNGISAIHSGWKI